MLLIIAAAVNVPVFQSYIHLFLICFIVFTPFVLLIILSLYPLFCLVV